jgi:glycosyltransferase involved in cell wall biosynthesis
VVSAFDEISRLVTRWRPHVLHLHSFWLWHIAKGLRANLGVPLVYTVHSLDRAEYELGQGPPECMGQWPHQEAVIYGADRVICLLQRYCPGVDARIRVVGNGIENARASWSAKSRNPDRPTVLFVGRFVERKGIRELIEAIALVHSTAPHVTFVLAGGHRDSTAEQMESWLLPTRLHAHRSHIRFTGWLTPEQLTQCYREADILIVPSWYEPFGMVILEGMVHGLAIAASAVGGPAEIIDDGRTGLLFPPCDATALAGAILRLVNDQVCRRRIARAAATEVRKTWLWSRVVDKMRSVYGELAAH